MMEGQDTLDHAVARQTDPATSHEAAVSIDKLPERQKAVLRIIEKHGPLTDTDLVRIYADADEINQSPSGIRTRRNELVAAQLVRDTAKREILGTGRRAILWDVTYRSDLGGES